MHFLGMPPLVCGRLLFFRKKKEEKKEGGGKSTTKLTVQRSYVCTVHSRHGRSPWQDQAPACLRGKWMVCAVLIDEYHHSAQKKLKH